MISFIIPFHSDDPHRVFAREFVHQNLEQDFPHAQVLIGYKDMTTEPFNRAAARNSLAKQAKGGVLVFLDADSVVPAAQLQQAVAQATSRGWALPYDHYYNLTNKGSARLYGVYTGTPTAFPPDEIEHVFPSAQDPEPAVGGCVVVTKVIFDRVHGYDERFKGWGEEDRAFVLALEKLSAPMLRIPGPLYHCWHPAPEEDRFGQPHFQMNRQLCNRYREADQRAMGVLVSEH